MRQELRGAASASLMTMLTGPPRPAELLAAFPDAIYLSQTGGHGGLPSLSTRVSAHASTAAGGAYTDSAEVIAVVAEHALRLPCAIVLPASDRLEVGSLVIDGAACALVGAGRVELPGATITVARWWQPRHPLPLRPAKDLVGRLDVVAGVLPSLPLAMAQHVRALSEAACAISRSDSALPRLGQAARSLVGLGPGLTPAGDDVLAAMLVTLTAGAPAARRLGAAIADAILPDASARTATLSAALLRHAARGEALPQLLDLIDGLASPRADLDITTLVASLVAVGSSSGAALAHGVLSAARIAVAVTDLSAQDVEVA